MRELSFPDIIERLEKAQLPSIDLVIGIATGGTVPAALIAQKLKCPLKMLPINFRDSQNKPRYEAPVHLGQSNHIIRHAGPVLLVDDVSVSGATLQFARAHIEAPEIYTFVLKGKADVVLFPEITECVNWPWKTDPPQIHTQE